MYDILNFKTYAKQMNDLTFTQYYYDLTLLVLSRIGYENLPNNINEKWIEKYLFSEGDCMFFKDDTLGYMVAKCSERELNHYDEPVYLTPTASNYHKTRAYKVGEECVLIRNNDLSIPTELKVRLFAWRLAEITRTQEININAQKTPLLIKCSDKQKLTLKNVYAQYNGNEPVIFADKNLDFNGLEVLKTDAPIVFDKLQQQKHQVMNEFLTLIGINNANQEKKERLVTDEVIANNEEIETFFNSMFKAREQAINEINKLFKLNIRVYKRVENKAVFEPQNDNLKDEVA